MKKQPRYGTLSDMKARDWAALAPLFCFSDGESMRDYVFGRVAQELGTPAKKATLEHCKNHESLCRAELLAIYDESPLYNRADLNGVPDSLDSDE